VAIKVERAEGSPAASDDTYQRYSFKTTAKE
jgi:hypothetical protein